MVSKISSQPRRWISLLTAALLVFCIGHIPFHLAFEEHSHHALETQTDSHHHGHEHEHDAGHQPHSSADHTLNFVPKSKVSLLMFDSVICEVAANFEPQFFLPVSIQEPFRIPDKSPPNRFSPRGPPAV